MPAPATRSPPPFRRSVTLLAATVLLGTGRGSGDPLLCAGRDDCSGHGECDDLGTASCVCDPQYSGERCDIWRAPARPALLQLHPQLRGVQSWENCTHGYYSNSSGAAGVMKLCETHNKSVCEAAGAPTVPPPNFTTSSCYGKPTVNESNDHAGGDGNASGFYNSGLCEDYRGVATVIHGRKFTNHTIPVPWFTLPSPAICQLQLPAISGGSLTVCLCVSSEGSVLRP